MKRFNYTGRKKVLRDDINIRLQGDFHEKPIVDVALNLDGYDFPPEGDVYLEPQWKTRFMRVHLGRVSNNLRMNGIPLHDFHDAEGLDFRIKVVDQGEGLLLGIAENVKPYNKDEELDQNQQSILPVSTVDLSGYGVLWRIYYGEDQQATLQVERELGSREQVVRSLFFRGFILPAAMHQILVKVVAEDWDEELADPVELSTRWLLFAQQIGAGLPDKKADDNEEWINEAVRILANRIGVRQQIIDEYDSGVWK